MQTEIWRLSLSAVPVGDAPCDAVLSNQCLQGMLGEICSQGFECGHPGLSIGVSLAISTPKVDELRTARL